MAGDLLSGLGPTIMVIVVGLGAVGLAGLFAGQFFGVTSFFQLLATVFNSISNMARWVMGMAPRPVLVMLFFLVGAAIAGTFVSVIFTYDKVCSDGVLYETSMYGAIAAKAMSPSLVWNKDTEEFSLQELADDIDDDPEANLDAIQAITASTSYRGGSAGVSGFAELQYRSQYGYDPTDNFDPFGTLLTTPAVLQNRQVPPSASSGGYPYLHIADLPIDAPIFFMPYNRLGPSVVNLANEDYIDRETIDVETFIDEIRAGAVVSKFSVVQYIFEPDNHEDVAPYGFELVVDGDVSGNKVPNCFLVANRDLRGSFQTIAHFNYWIFQERREIGRVLSESGEFQLEVLNWNSEWNTINPFKTANAKFGLLSCPQPIDATNLCDDSSASFIVTDDSRSTIQASGMKMNNFFENTFSKIYLPDDQLNTIQQGCIVGHYVSLNSIGLVNQSAATVGLIDSGSMTDRQNMIELANKRGVETIPIYNKVKQESGLVSFSCVNEEGLKASSELTNDDVQIRFLGVNPFTIKAFLFLALIFMLVALLKFLKVI